MGLFRKKKKPKIDLKRKFGSFAFFFSMPVAAALVLVSVSTLLRLAKSQPFEPTGLSLFGLGIILAIIVFHGRGWQRLKTFLHELKHAVLIVLTGNKLTGFSFGKGVGSVEYRVYEENMHFEPFVLLAPYFLPLLSFPVLAVAVIAAPDFRAQFLFLLGYAWGIDAVMAAEEFHPGQTDLQRIFGGIFIAFPFILLANVAWTALCLVWLFAGNAGFVELAEESVTLSETAVALIRQLL